MSAKKLTKKQQEYIAREASRYENDVQLLWEDRLYQLFVELDADEDLIREEFGAMT